VAVISDLILDPFASVANSQLPPICPAGKETMISCIFYCAGESAV
jgi:hypothetical protein